MPFTKMTSDGRIALPKPVREALRIRSGDRIDFVRMTDGSFLMHAATKSVMRLKGTIPKPSKPVSLQDMDAAIGEQLDDV
jgi:AbrB family looped-hinge helix DNA binding protein